MAFHIRYEQYEFFVMLLGLTNAPVVFIDMINQVFQPYLDLFVIVFNDDILIQSKSWKEHEEHLHQAIQTLKSHRLYAKLSKCEF